MRIPVAVKTSRGELFTGMARGVPYAGRVTLTSDRGVNCSGKYTTDERYVVHAPEVFCSDGRAVSFSAPLDDDRVSTGGAVRFSTGETATVGAGKRARLIR